MRTLILAALATALAAADPASAALEHLRAANVARGELARERAAWTAESQRLEALIAATIAETSRLTGEAVAAEGVRDAARARLAALGAEGDLDALRARLGEAGVAMAARLRALAATLPPGIVSLGDDQDFDAVVRALEGAERAAGTVTVEVVSGFRDGHTEAVKLLRAAGAAVWWVSLDGQAAGTARVAAGVLMLATIDDEAERVAISAALAQAEGRIQPALVLLPGGAP